MTEEKKTAKKRLIYAASLILLVCFVAFIPALENGFTHWDDDVLVTENMMIRDLSWHNVGHYFTSYYISTYIPLTLLSFALEYQVAGLDPHVYHLTNILIHLVNCVLVFFLIFLITRDIRISLITSLLFGLHPLRVESVAWVTERKDVLFSLFFLAALISYLIFHIKMRIKYYFFSIAMFVLSALAKGMAITLPFVVLLIDYYLKRPLNKKTIIEKVPYFFITLIFGVLALFAQFPSIARRVEPLVKFPATIFIACRNILFYLFKIILPIRLCALYPYPDLTRGLLPVFFYISLVIIAVLVVAMVYVSRHSRKLIFGSVFFLINIVTVIGIIPLAGDAIAADRYTYIPSIGILFLFALGFDALYSKEHVRFKHYRTILISVLVLIFGILSFLTWQRCKVWKNDAALWQDALTKYPSAVAYNNIGLVFYEQDQFEKAISYYNGALGMNPEYSIAYYNRANAHDAKGDYTEAIADYTRAIELDNRSAKAFNNRGLSYGRTGQYDKAISDFTEAVRIDTAYAPAYNNRGMIHGRFEQHEQAISDFTRAIEIIPDYAKAYYNRAITYYNMGEYGKALSDAEQARSLGCDVDPRVIQMLRGLVDESR